jgi:hypothetical protein
MTGFTRTREEAAAFVDRFVATSDLLIQGMHDDFDAEALFERVRMLKRMGPTRIHIPEAAKAQGL